MAELNPALLVALAGALSGAFMAALAIGISRAPGWRELRSFAVVAVVASVYCFLALVHVVPMSTSARLLGERLLFAASITYGMAWIRHLAIVDQRPLRRLERFALIVGGVMVVASLIPGVMVVAPIREVPVRWFGVTYMMATGTTLGVLSVCLTVGAVVTAAFAGGRRWRDGFRAQLPMIGATALALAGVTDTLASMQLISMPQLIEAVTVAVVGGMGLSYARRFIADAQRLEALSTRLELEVASRTDELMKAHADIAQQEKLAGLGRVAAGVAHEINNPTAVIQQNLELLRKNLSDGGQLTSELTTRFDRSLSATRRIADIVRQLLHTGDAPPAGPLHTAPFLLAPVVESAKIAASASVPELQVSHAISPSLAADGDPALVEQVLINLLINAAHATTDAGSGSRIEIVAETIGERARVTVRDNGSGIPTAIRERLFEPFTTTKPIGEGTGLGLAVSRGLMTQQGGSLVVGSTGEQGTEMVLELPLASNPDATPDGKLRILVIDDNDDLRETLTALLRRYFRADESATVAEALAMVAEGHTYDVVLCDVMMPEVGAEGWLSGCRALDPRLADRTILVTGGSTSKASSKLLKERHDKVILKPFEFPRLQAMIERVAMR